jgi:hypothetical protein
MKKGIFIGALVTLLCVPSYAYAKGSANVRFEGNTNVNVNDEFKVNMVIDNVSEAEGGIVGYAGYIKYDNSILEIVDAKSANNYFDIYKNDSINKIVGIDMTLNHGITSKTNVYEITFRGIKEGNTTIYLKDADLSDKEANIIDATVNGLNVNVNAIKIEENKEVKPSYTVNKAEKVETHESVIEEHIENKEEIKEIKTTKKEAKSTKKQEKNLLKLVSKFFKRIFKKRK